MVLSPHLKTKDLKIISSRQKILGNKPKNISMSSDSFSIMFYKNDTWIKTAASLAKGTKVLQQVSWKSELTFG